MHASELDTPALVVDLDIMERNLARVAAYTSEHGLRLRPHTKTHKSTVIGRRQLNSGAAGLTVAKVSEAEVMLGAAPPDMLVAFPVVGRLKLERLMEVAKKTRVTVALDSLEAARPLSDVAHAAQVEVGVLVEIDAGLGRVGVAPDRALEMARCLRQLPGLSFEGIAFYPGHIREMDEQGRAAMQQVGQILGSLLFDFTRAGIPVNIVSGGSTPTLFHSHTLPEITEIRPGTYVYNDLNTVRTGGCELEDCAASILATVVSTARPGQIIVDGGSKTFSSDRPANGSDVTFGRLVEAPAARFHKMNEEHGFVDVTGVDRTFAVGDRVHIIPNHICVAVNLHERIYGLRGGQVEETWTVEGRGKLQ
jgi:D-serine deaminase-like pyridoxal phosphate-dependent protein